MKRPRPTGPRPGINGAFGWFPAISLFDTSVSHVQLRVPLVPRVLRGPSHAKVLPHAARPQTCARLEQLPPARPPHRAPQARSARRSDRRHPPGAPSRRAPSDAPRRSPRAEGERAGGSCSAAPAPDATNRPPAPPAFMKQKIRLLPHPEQA